MRAETFVRACALLFIVGGPSILAAPGQTAQPGQIEPARVWIQNRSRAEAIPVALRDVNLDAPLKVQIANSEPQNVQVAGVVQVRDVRRIWEYETIVVKPAEDLAVRLNGEGATGWETTGIWSASADGATTVLLKRAR